MNIYDLLKVVLMKSVSSSGGAIFQLFILLILPLSQVGHLNKLLAFAMGVAVLLHGGIGFTLLREASYYWRSNQREKVEPIFVSCLKVLSFKSLLIASIILAAYFIFFYYVHYDVFIITDILFVILFSILFSILILQSSVLKSIQRVPLSSFSEMGQAYFISTLIGLAFWYLLTIKLPVMPLLLLTAGFLVLFSYFAMKFYLKPYRKSVKNFESPKHEVDLFLITFFNYLSQWGVIIVFSFYYDDENTGAFSTAIRFGMLLNFLLMVSDQFVIPKISYFYREKKFKDLEILLRKSASVLFLMGCIFQLSFVLIGNLIDIKDEYKNIYYMTAIVLSSQLINISTGSTGYLLVLTGNQRKVLAAIIVGSATGLIVMTILGLKDFSSMYTASAYALIPALTTVISSYYVKKTFGFYCVPSVKIWFKKY